MLENIVTLLYLSGEPVSYAYIAELCGVTKEEVLATLPQIDATLHTLGLQLLRTDTEVSIVTNASQSAFVEKFWKEDLKGELTSATLQVLTLVAYIGPCTRHDVSFIRGVQSTQSIRTLTVRGLIEKKGEVCSLSSDAMKHLGITEVSQLPEYESIRKELLAKLELARAE
jgi:segregation and condensation protein B